MNEESNFVFNHVVACDKPNPGPAPDPGFEYDPVVKTYSLIYQDSQTNPKDWSKCATKDYVVFDMFDSTLSEFNKCAADGAKMICYFSSQYEEWRPDAGDFRSQDLGRSLDGWAGEKWVDIKSGHVKNIMRARMNWAQDRGCDVVDVDNVDFYHYRTGFDNSRQTAIDYIEFLANEAHARNMEFSLKNATEIIAETYQFVDMYQNEQCQQYNECEIYKGLGKPVFNIEYKEAKCKAVPYMYSVVKNMNRMHAYEKVCN